MLDDGNGSVRNTFLFQPYVDDICVGGDTVKETSTLHSQLVSMLAKSGLKPKNWSNNVPSVLSTVSAENRTNGSLSFDTFAKEDNKKKLALFKTSITPCLELNAVFLFAK